MTLLESIAQLRSLVCTAQEAPSLYRHAAEHSICGADIDGLAVRFTRGRLLLAVYLAEENSSLPEFLPVLWEIVWRTGWSPRFRCMTPTGSRGGNAG